jgi:hypothetical protein
LDRFARALLQLIRVNARSGHALNVQALDDFAMNLVLDFTPDGQLRIA